MGNYLHPTPQTPNPKMPPSSELHKIQGFCSMPGMGHVFRAGEPGREESSIRVLAFAPGELQQSA